MGKKKYKKYDPGVPMTKEQLKEWRKEARKVRNRESAALSRWKTQNRIVELESEMSRLSGKYQRALERIQQLEATRTSNVVSSTFPSIEKEEQDRDGTNNNGTTGYDPKVV